MDRGSSHRCSRSGGTPEAIRASVKQHKAELPRISTCIIHDTGTGKVTGLGWTNRPGAHIDAPWWTATFWTDGSRPTRPDPATTARDVILVLGCSYTQGYGVGDADTFAWKLQQRFPRYDVRNFGTGGYGTYQSLLRFRRMVRQ